MYVIKPYSASASLGLGVLLVSSLPAFSSVITSPDIVERRGSPIAQQFLDEEGDNVSLVASRLGVSCVASQPLPIAEALYLNAVGTTVPFTEVTRSPASSIQAIAQPGGATGFRVQLKYSPDPSKPILLEVGNRTLDLVSALEGSSDSLWLSGEDARILEAALRVGEQPTMRATSTGTGRQIADRVVAPDMAGLDACIVTLDALQTAEDIAALTDIAEDGANNLVPAKFTLEAPVDVVNLERVATEPALPVPVAGLRVELVAHPDPEALITQSTLESCRMRDIPDELYLGRLTSVTGFFAQTRDVYVSFDDTGQIERAYVPGIFDSNLSLGVNSAFVSLAADSNLPDQPNSVRGCLGDARLEASVCVISESDDGSFVLAECGVLGMTDTREDFLSFLMGDAPPSLLTRPAPGTIGGPIPTISAVRPSVFGGIGGSGGWGGGHPVAGAPGIVPDGGIEIGGGGTGGGGGGGGGGNGGGDWGFDGDETGGEGGGGNGDGPADMVSSVPLPAGIWLMLTALILLPGVRAFRRIRTST